MSYEDCGLPSEQIEKLMRDGIEDAAKTLVAWNVPYSTPINLSIAISLKRIADNMLPQITIDQGAK